ncbi:MAG TPA: guanylate kinase [Acidimicrobiia bacterium]|nr:guanylate kinase [Acidimicrobiia bacterium]
MLLVLAGPSGVGKGTIGARLRAEHPDLRWSVSWTTRARRDGERDGHDYHFVARDEFEALRDAGGFLESFEVFGDLKGTPREPIEAAIRDGAVMLLEIDVQGALVVEAAYPDATLVVFVRAPSREVQRARLVERGTDTAESIERRLAEADQEEAVAEARGWPVVVNDDLGRATAQVTAILDHRRPGV